MRKYTKGYTCPYWFAGPSPCDKWGLEFVGQVNSWNVGGSHYNLNVGDIHGEMLQKLNFAVQLQC